MPVPGIHQGHRHQAHGILYNAFCSITGFSKILCLLKASLLIYLLTYWVFAFISFVVCETVPACKEVYALYFAFVPPGVTA